MNPIMSLTKQNMFKTDNGAVTAHDVQEIVRFFRYLIQTDHVIAQEYVAFRAKERILK